ncbi:hypothetical protein [Streptomyces katrae]|nr:hypothetical protein [Streptomyces katrae]
MLQALLGNDMEARLTQGRPEDPLTVEEIDLGERLQAQPHPNAEK